MVKTFAVAMLVRANWRWLVAYLAADHGMYILYKIARADLIYFAQGAATAHACAHGDAPSTSCTGRVFWLVYKGAGVALSLVCRLIEKLVLDATGFVQQLHAFNAGGAYYCFNAGMTHAACFVAAALYSAYYTGIAPDNASYSPTGGKYTDANATNTTAASTTVLLLTNGTVAGYAGKIDDVTLFAAIGTLSAVWVIAFVGLLLTMKCEHVGTFVSLQTGCAFSQSHFLDHEGDDARRSHILNSNERHWRSIRELVRQWVLGAYATWLQLSPACSPTPYAR
jgi:hypothetical protein